MNRTHAAAVALAALTLASTAFAQNTEGRTDGPEGSEIGHGGYTSDFSARYSLSLNWGASIQEAQPLSGAQAMAPLFVGITGSYWADETLILELSAAYLFNNNRVNLLVGPKVRTGFYPVSLYAALKAGAVLMPTYGIRFALSPEVGADVLIRRKVTLGLGYAADIAFGGNGLNHRIFMSIGYRF